MKLSVAWCETERAWFWWAPWARHWCRLVVFGGRKKNGDDLEPMNLPRTTNLSHGDLESSLRFSVEVHRQIDTLSEEVPAMVELGSVTKVDELSFFDGPHQATKD